MIDALLRVLISQRRTSRMIHHHFSPNVLTRLRIHHCRHSSCVLCLDCTSLPAQNKLVSRNHANVVDETMFQMVDVTNSSTCFIITSGGADWEYCGECVYASLCACLHGYIFGTTRPKFTTFLPRDAMLAVVVCLSVRLSQAGIVSKRLQI